MKKCYIYRCLKVGTNLCCEECNLKCPKRCLNSIRNCKVGHEETHRGCKGAPIID